MNTKPSAATAPPPGTVTWRDVVLAACKQVDWKAIATAALDSPGLGELFGESVILIANVFAAEGRKPRRPRPSPAKKARRVIKDSPTEPPTPKAEAQAPDVETPEVPTPQPVDAAVLTAAAMLDVTVDATEQQIRSALRARLSESRAHPDHGGDGDHAKRLIGARELLLKHVRSQR